MSNQENKCCEKCIRLTKEGVAYRTCYDVTCPCHSTPTPKEEERIIKLAAFCPKKDCDKNCNYANHPTTLEWEREPAFPKEDWEKEFDRLFIQVPDRLAGDKWAEAFAPTVQKFALEIKEFTKKELAHARLTLLQEIEKEIMAILEDEIKTAHTTEAGGKTSRLTSAYNRISQLIKDKYLKK